MQFIGLLSNLLLLIFLAFKDKHCQKQKFKKLVGDESRKCYSIKKVSIAVCAGFCVPQQLIKRLKLFSKKYSKLNSFVCTVENTKTKNVLIYCPDDGSTTRYKVKIVKTCKCELRTPFEKQSIAHDIKKLNSNTNPA